MNKSLPPISLSHSLSFLKSFLNESVTLVQKALCVVRSQTVMHNVFSKSLYLLRDVGHRPLRQTDQATHRTQTTTSDRPGKT